MKSNHKDRCTPENRLCHHYHRVCGASHPTLPEHCIRQAGHNGDHIACGDIQHNYAHWPKQKKGFALLSASRRAEIAKLGGKTISRNHRHMKLIGRTGGQHTQRNWREKVAAL